MIVQFYDILNNTFHHSTVCQKVPLRQKMPNQMHKKTWHPKGPVQRPVHPQVQAAPENRQQMILLVSKVPKQQLQIRKQTLPIMLRKEDRRVNRRQLWLLQQIKIKQSPSLLNQQLMEGTRLLKVSLQELNQQLQLHLQALRQHLTGPEEELKITSIVRYKTP